MLLIDITRPSREAPGFLENVRRTGDLIQKTCAVGPVESIGGRGLLIGMRMREPAAKILPRLLDLGILAGGAKDPRIVRLLPPLIVGEAEVAKLRLALEKLE